MRGGIKSIIGMCVDTHPKQINLQEIVTQTMQTKDVHLKCTIKNLCQYTFDVDPMNLQKITIQTNQTKNAHTCVQERDMDPTHPNQSDNLQER